VFKFGAVVAAFDKDLSDLCWGFESGQDKREDMTYLIKFSCASSSRRIYGLLPCHT
jgi:hypothetical protein